MGSSSGEAILNAELEMIHSLDVCDQVAKVIGPGKILSKGQGTNDIDAAFVAGSNWFQAGKEVVM